MPAQENFKKYLKESVKNLRISEHMTYITFPIVNEKKLILRIFEEIVKSIKNTINAAIEYEFINQNLILHENKEKNIENFLENLSEKYEISKEEIKRTKEILQIDEKYKKSAMEFVKNNKVVIMSENLKIHTINIEQVKTYLILAKQLFIKISSKVKF